MEHEYDSDDSNNAGSGDISEEELEAKDMKISLDELRSRKRRALATAEELFLEEQAQEELDAPTDDEVSKGESNIKDISDDTPMEAFYMDEKEKHGHFDKSGFFVLNRNVEDSDEEAPEDAWLDDYQHRAAKRQRIAPTIAETSGTSSVPELTAEQLYRIILKNLDSPTETVLQALRRLGSASGDVNAAQFNTLTEAADTLVSMDVYQLRISTIEELVYPKAQPVMYEYQWEKDTEIFGPFTSTEMEAWKKQGYFVAPHLALIRKVGDTNFVNSDTMLSF